MVTLFRQANLMNLSLQSEIDLVRQVLHGLPSSAITSVSSAGYDLQTVMSVVGPRTTLQRKIANHAALAVDESDRLARLTRIIALAEEVFGNAAKAKKWLERTSRTLGEAPFQLLTSDQGTKLVEDRLIQIGHGMFA